MAKIDANEVPRDSEIETDLCILGGGAAGLAIAWALRAKPIRVTVLESGGMDYHEPTQELYGGKSVGEPYSIKATRLRRLSGSLNHWAGECRQLDPIDFTQRDWIPHSGWPIGLDDLAPHYQKAQLILGLGRYGFDMAARAKELNDSGFGLAPGDWEPRAFNVWTRAKCALMPNTKVVQAKNVTAYTWANVVEIASEGTDPGRVTKVRVATLRGNAFTVRARHYVLALGGIENPRLLLCSNGTQPEGLGNGNDLVGRFFMEHPHVSFGYLVPFDGVSDKLYRLRTRKDNTGLFAALGISAATQEREKLINFAALVYRHRATNKRQTDRAKTQLERVDMSEELLRGARLLVHRTGEESGHAFATPGMFHIGSRTEQTPNPDSRVTLLEDKDKLGVPRAQLDWRVRAEDWEAMSRISRLFGAAVGAARVGRFRSNIHDPTNPPPMAGVGHHMGTTRMASDPSTGVVDENCRVFGIDNLYVAGSSVFPTSGFANPTLTLVALALRLAAHLEEKPR